jgi:hypothetical protein
VLKEAAAERAGRETQERAQEEREQARAAAAAPETVQPFAAVTAAPEAAAAAAPAPARPPARPSAFPPGVVVRRSKGAGAMQLASDAVDEPLGGPSESERGAGSNPEEQKGEHDPMEFARNGSRAANATGEGTFNVTQAYGVAVQARTALTVPLSAAAAPEGSVVRVSFALQPSSWADADIEFSVRRAPPAPPPSVQAWEWPGGPKDYSLGIAQALAPEAGHEPGRAQYRRQVLASKVRHVLAPAVFDNCPDPSAQQQARAQARAREQPPAQEQAANARVLRFWGRGADLELVWDNCHSWMNAKHVVYSVTVFPPPPPLSRVPAAIGRVAQDWHRPSHPHLRYQLTEGEDGYTAMRCKYATHLAAAKGLLCGGQEGLRAQEAARAGLLPSVTPSAAKASNSAAGAEAGAEAGGAALQAAQQRAGALGRWRDAASGVGPGGFAARLGHPVCKLTKWLLDTGLADLYDVDDPGAAAVASGAAPGGGAGSGAVDGDCATLLHWAVITKDSQMATWLLDSPHLHQRMRQHLPVCARRQQERRPDAPIVGWPMPLPLPVQAAASVPPSDAAAAADGADGTAAAAAEQAPGAVELHRSAHLVGDADGNSAVHYAACCGQLELLRCGDTLTTL